MQKAKPAITVLMPAYNAGAYVGEAIESVLAQSFPDFEFLIIDDGSTDDTLKIIRGFQDERIRVVSRPNKGLIVSLNEGLQLAEASLIARHDADDVCLPKRLERQYSYLKNNPHVLLVGSDAAYIDKSGNYVCPLAAPIGHSHEEMWRRRFEKCPFIHPSVMFQKQAVLALGGYPNHALLFEDWLLWLRLMQVGPVYNLPETLLHVRLNPESVTADERWYAQEFREIRQRSLHEGKVAEQDATKLATLVRGQSSNAFKQAAYHAVVAKKYLWDNHQPGLARQHLREVIRHCPKRLEPYALYLLSFLPEGLISTVYKAAKRK